MSKFKNLLVGFLKSRLTKSALLRVVSVSVFSMGTTLGVVYANYQNYWEGTIYRTQTVDFNILSNLLPTKLSIYLSKTHLAKHDIESLQKTLNSNYGLFGIIVTNCKIAARECPGQKIIYASKAKIEEMPDGKQKRFYRICHVEL